MNEQQLHDDFCDDIGKALLEFLGHQTLGGVPINKLRLQPAEETLTDQE